MITRLLPALLFVLGLMNLSCLDRDLGVLTPCTISGVVEEVSVSAVEKVDLLFMVDNSGSMNQEQASLTREFPQLVEVLTTGDRTCNGMGTCTGAATMFCPRPDGSEPMRSCLFPPVKDLHIGVISTDMGTAGYTIASCGTGDRGSDFGDDGILRTDGSTAAGCAMTYPPFLSFMSDMGMDPATVARDFACVATLGITGCGMEQQLEAVLKAVTPSTSDITFLQGSAGHADGANAGFLRGPMESLLALVLVTDEEDCSIADPDLFNPTSTAYPHTQSELNLLCFNYGSRPDGTPWAAHPVQRYVDGLLATRARPDLLVYAAIAGIPVELSGRSYDSILADPRMEPQIDPGMTNLLLPSCNTANGTAFPPVRIVETARGLEAAEANTVVQSICQDDFGPAIDSIIEKIANALGGACLPRALNPDENDMVSCDVAETLPRPGEGRITECTMIAGREAVGTEDGRQVCRVAQVTPAMAAAGQPGWFYDDSPPMMGSGGCAQRITYTENFEPAPGTDVRLECLQPVQNMAGGIVMVGLGTPCATTDPCGAVGLVCHGQTNTCQKDCDSDAVCGSAGYPGFRCDRGICVNPTCSE